MLCFQSRSITQELVPEPVRGPGIAPPAVGCSAERAGVFFSAAGTEITCKTESCGRHQRYNQSRENFTPFESLDVRPLPNGIGLAECRLNIDAQLISTRIGRQYAGNRSSTLQNETPFRGSNVVHLHKNWDQASPDGTMRRPMPKDAL